MHSSLPIAGLLLLAGCVHTDVSRIGRQRLGDGSEGLAPILASVTGDFDEVAVLTVGADAASTVERRERHLSRRAALLGCDAVIRVRHEAALTTGICARRRGDAPESIEIAYLVAAPSPDLVTRARAAGPEGLALLSVLDQVERRSESQRAWPLRWYLATYPDSPFRADVEAMIVPAPEISAGEPHTILTAPTAK
jgi:hypothetical protein